MLIAIGVSIYAAFVAGGTENLLDGGEGLQSQAESPLASPPAAPVPPASVFSGATSTDAADLIDAALAEDQIFGNFDGQLQSLSSEIPPEAASAISSVTGSAPSVDDTSNRPCEPTASSLYCIYTVMPGDTLSVVAEEFGLRGSESLPPAEILAESNKPAVVQSDIIVPGLKLRIPVENGIIHTVLVSETLPEVAERYGVTTFAIENLALNNISDPDLLLIGQELLVPNPVGVFHRQTEAPATLRSSTEAEEDIDAGQESQSPEPSATAASTATTEPTATPEPTQTPEPGESTATPLASTATPTATATAAVATETSGPVVAEPTATATLTPTASRNDPTGLTCSEYETFAPLPDPANPSAAGFIWPASGPLSSCFGPAHPLGIDIDFFSEPNQAVAAAASGTVIFAGGNPDWSYGYYVVIDHGNGFTTLYAHLSLIGVNAGQVINQGQTLGLGGRTGYATGNHLHFELLFDGDPINPLPYLP